MSESAAALTAMQVDALLDSLRGHLRFLDAARTRHNRTEPSQSPGGDMYAHDIMLDVPIVAVLLGRIVEHLRYLRRSPDAWVGGLAQKGQAFLDLADSEEMQGVRNVLEHVAAYIAGDGHNPSLVVDAGAYSWEAWSGDNNWAMHVFGRGYDLSTCLYAADELHDVVRAS